MMVDQEDGRGTHMMVDQDGEGFAWSSSVPQNTTADIKKSKQGASEETVAILGRINPRLAQNDQSKAGCTADDDPILIPLAKAMPKKVIMTREFDTVESPCAATLFEETRKLELSEETRMVAETLDMEAEDTLAAGMRLNAIMVEKKKARTMSQTNAAMKIPKPPDFPPPGFVGPGPGAPPKKSCGPLPLNVPPPPPPPVSFPPAPDVGATSKPCKFIPTPGDYTGMQLRALKDKHNERESRRRARRAREAEALLNVLNQHAPAEESL